MPISSRLLSVIWLLALTFSVAAQNKIPAPADVLGFAPGDDRKLASWNQVVSYFQKLDAASNRVKFEEIGKSTGGNPFVVAYISATENLAQLEKYRQINAKLADPRTFKSSDAAAKQLIQTGKTIVLITCGIHSDEVGSYLSSMLIAHKLASSNEAEIQKILRETIVILVPSLNPDGVDIIKNWYDKTLGTPFEGTDPPELYNKYTGHDDNRDWYAFTQTETQLTVDKIHNVWHPQIVNDIHQRGPFGSRLFLPPYMQPVEPNVPKEIIEGYTELGSYIATEMRGRGFQGITTDSTYDAWTPARAYSHYHGGVRILSETASCRLATPINVNFNQLSGNDNGIGYDAKVESKNFSPVWKGGEWHLRDITNYMTTAAFLLMKHAADNREKWLTRFYAIGKEAIRPRRNGELSGFLLPPFEGNLEEILERGGLKLIDTDSGILVKMQQPYGGFAKALLEKQIYPNLKDQKGNPTPPYDTTAHTLPLLLGVEVEKVFVPYRYGGNSGGRSNDNLPCKKHNEGNAIYKSHIPSIDEGWTRWALEDKELPPHCFSIASTNNSEIFKGNLFLKLKTIIFPDQSPNQILNGFPKGSMPDEYTGGVGRDGVENLRKFVEAGGTLVFLNRASDFAIEQFNLPVRDVTKGLARKDFYIPGSILRTRLDTNNPLAKGMAKESIAWFENSPAFEISMSRDTNVEIIASYPTNPKDILLSGWALGAEKIAGKAALISISIGQGKIVLFGFRPQYRGQSLATFPLLFNAITDNK